MSYRQRQKRRMKRMAANTAQSRSRETGSSKGQWWLTSATRPASCNRCGRTLRTGMDCIYRHVPREILCLLCAKDASLPYRASIGWERLRAGRA
jgi:hypothetical protein